MLACTYQVDPEALEYIAQFNIALNQWSDITEIKAKLLFKENLWPEVGVQAVNYQLSTLKNS